MKAIITDFPVIIVFCPQVSIEYWMIPNLFCSVYDIKLT